MDEKLLRKTLTDIPLGGLKYFEKTGSTNDVALAWATEGAPDFSLVVADEQTSGRGRFKRRWLTPPDSALAFSLILRPVQAETEQISLFTGLGALALTKTLKLNGLNASIKWPNDVLLNGRKTAGILAEAVWLGDKVESVVLGIGVNVSPESVPPDESVQFPATSIQTEGLKTDRLALLHVILLSMVSLRSQLGTERFIKEWDDHLAYIGEQVRVWEDKSDGSSASESSLQGVVRGLGPDGSLILQTAAGLRSVQFGEIHLRPA